MNVNIYPSGFFASFNYSPPPQLQIFVFKLKPPGVILYFQIFLPGYKYTTNSSRLQQQVINLIITSHSDDFHLLGEIRVNVKYREKTICVVGKSFLFIDKYYLNGRINLIKKQYEEERF